MNQPKTEQAAGQRGADGIDAAIQRIISEVAKIPPEEIHPDNPVTGITNVDSILLLEIVALTELELGIEISEEDLFAANTVGDFVEICRRLTSQTA